MGFGVRFQVASDEVEERRKKGKKLLSCCLESPLNKLTGDKSIGSGVAKSFSLEWMACCP